MLGFDLDSFQYQDWFRALNTVHLALVIFVKLTPSYAENAKVKYMHTKWKYLQIILQLHQYKFM